jgi:hypothetical protein
MKKGTVTNCPPLSSRLRFVENEKEYGHTQGAKGIDKRREQHDRGNQSSQNVQHTENQIPNQKCRYQNRSDQREKCRIFKRHARSMSALSTTCKGRGLVENTRQPIASNSGPDSGTVPPPPDAWR